MRLIQKPQFKLGKTAAIANLIIDLKSRDDRPPLLLGLQHIYTTPELRDKVFTILEEKVQPWIALYFRSPRNLSLKKIT